MSKLKHYLKIGDVYYVTSVTMRRQRLFRNRRTCFLLLSNIAYHRYMLDFSLIGYVIMPDHFHLILQPQNRYFSLDKIMNFIKGNFARKYNQLNKVSGHVWQKGYYETVLRTERDLFNRLNYTHNNPVRKGLVEKAEDYEFSSARQYLKNYRKTFQIPIDPIY